MLNGLLFQAFEWHLSDDGNYYKDLMAKLDELKAIGVSAIWLPPVYKGTGSNDVGYGPYDLFDLGEFDQKGSVRTKYGTKEELKVLIDKIHEKNIKVYADVVINHKAGGDEKERFMAVMVDQANRSQEVSEPQEIEGWTSFIFPCRGNQYSDFKWNFNHFSGVDYDDLTQTKAIYRITGENKGWSLGVSQEKGNFDYLMFSNIDHAHQDVQEELKNWAIWFIDELDLDGFRLDALKHIDEAFMHDFISHIKSIKGDDFYFVGEYWLGDTELNSSYLGAINYKADLFDIGLHFNLHSASKGGVDYDLREIFKGTLSQLHPSSAVTFVDNHDSQPGQSLESFVEPWFKEIAYGLIFLRKDAYPCLFYGDYYGLSGDKPQAGFKDQIQRLAQIRQTYAYGDQDDYFQDKNCIGWVRHGDEDHPNKCAVILSNGDINQIRMFVGKDQASKAYADYLGNHKDKVTINEDGFGEFLVPAGSICVWIEEGLDL